MLSIESLERLCVRRLREAACRANNQSLLSSLEEVLPKHLLQQVQPVPRDYGYVQRAVQAERA